MSKDFQIAYDDLDWNMHIPRRIKIPSSRHTDWFESCGEYKALPLEDGVYHAMLFGHDDIPDREITAPTLDDLLVKVEQYIITNLTIKEMSDE